MYLHVITYNEGAIRLDERRGFARVKVIKGEGAFFVRFPPGRTGSRRAFSPGPDGFPRAEERDFDRPPAIMAHFVFTFVFVCNDDVAVFVSDYYTINSVNYDCHLYARYFHGESVAR